MDKYLSNKKEDRLKEKESDLFQSGEAVVEIKSDRENVIDAVARCGMHLMNLSTELRADKEVVLTAVRKNGDALVDASEELRNDETLKKLVRNW
jgi:hypothetical protein